MKSRHPRPLAAHAPRVLRLPSLHHALTLYAIFCLALALLWPTASFASGPPDLATAPDIASDTAGKPLSRQDFLDQATQASRSAQDTERLTNGQVLVRVPLQALEAKIGPKGVQLNSINAGGSAAFAWKLAAWGRENDGDGRMQALGRGTVEQSADQVLVTHGALQEQFSASSNGLRQDFVISERPAGTSDLVLRIQTQGASLQALDNTDQAVALELDDGRLLHYHALQVTDANGKPIPAHMQVSAAQTLRIAVQDQHAQYPLRVDPTFSDADWTSLVGPDFDGVINASVFANGSLYVGGGFTASPNGPAKFIAQWNGTAWSALGSGMNGSVSALAWDGVGNRLFTGGNFSTAGGITVNRIAQWDGTAWSALGSGMNNAVYALAWDGVGNRLFAGGNFSTAGGNPATYIAQWDSTTQAWSALGSGMDNIVYALAWDGVGNRLFAGGFFSTAGGITAKFIAQWDDKAKAWSALGSGMGGTVYALAWDGVGNRLFAGGFFSTAGGNPAKYIAQWDSTTQAWSALGSGMNNAVYALAWDGVGNRLFAGGNFSTAGGTAANHIAQWDGSAWSALGSGMNGSVTALAWDGVGNRLFAGGDFSTAGGKLAKIAAAHLSVYHTLTYTAGANGTITGTTPQTVNHGASGTVVTATPNAGYRFDKWSDGNTSAARTDSNVTSALSVSASFVARNTSYTGSLPDGSQATVTLENAAGTCEYTSAAFSSTPPPDAPQGYSFPLGVWQFEAQGCPGNTTVRIQYATALPADALLYKYGPPAAGAAAAWFELAPAEVTLNAAHDTVSYVVVDNGRGDSNTQQDMISDPFIVAVKAASPIITAPTPVPSLSSAAIVLLNLVAALFAALGLRWRRSIGKL